MFKIAQLLPSLAALDELRASCHVGRWRPIFGAKLEAWRHRGWWREDMDFMFEWQEQYLTNECSERVRYCSCHENIKFISLSQREMFFLLYGETNSTKAKGGNCGVIERYER